MTAIRRLVVATANRDKVAEMAALLGPDVELAPRPLSVPDVEEDAPDLVGNARLKASTVCAATGEPAVADDTGLFVAALGGRPGVRTARFAGEGATYEDNVSALLAAMAGQADRRSEFRTVALVSLPSGAEMWAQGVARGTISDRPRGSLGFGYDPLFVPERGGGLTFAEMTMEQKNRCSHRSAAFAALAVLLR